MLSDEEKKAIETIKDFKNLKWYEHAFDNGTEVLDEEEKQDIDIILNLIQKQQCELDNKDKIIIAMAEQLTTPVHGIDWVIDYFTKKVGGK